MATKKGNPTLPVRFLLTEDGNYAIWDNGGRVGERGLVMRQAGEIVRHVITDGVLRWELRRDGHAPRNGFLHVVEAKNVYMQERAIPINPLEYIPQSGPPAPLVLVDIGMGEWERLDEWRARVFGVLCRRNGATVTTVMLTPVASDYRTRTHTLRLPEPVADDLERWRQRW